MNRILSILLAVSFLWIQGCGPVELREKNTMAFGEQQQPRLQTTRPQDLNIPSENASPPVSETMSQSDSVESTPIAASVEPEIYKAKLAAVGDILIHSTVYKAAQTPNGYNFNPAFSNMKPYLSQADITLTNQESMIGGVKHGLSTYPSFNSPQQIGDALKEAGIDMVTVANNHTLDRGEKIIQSALQYWDQLGVPYTGAFKDMSDQQHIRLLVKNGITFSFLAYTYGTNGIPVPKEKPYLVNLIDLTKIKQEVALAKQQSDVIVVSLHFGEEYTATPNAYQKEIVQALADEGVHIIIGHHPHVLQPTAWVEGKGGNRTFVAYSLGNFLSGQRGSLKDIGGIVQIEVEKEINDGKTLIHLINPAFVPTWVSKDLKTIHLLQDVKSKKQEFEKIRQHMKQWMPELKFYFFE